MGMNVWSWREWLETCGERLASPGKPLSGVRGTWLMTGGGRPVDLSRGQLSGTGVGGIWGERLSADRGRFGVYVDNLVTPEVDDQMPMANDQ